MHLRAVLFLCAGQLFFAGCQHLPRAPLEVESHLEDWRAREVNITPIAALSQQLAANDVYGAHETFDVSDGLSLNEAEAVGLWYNPGLRVARAESGTALALKETAGLLPDPELDLEAGRKREEEDGSGFFNDAAETTRSWVASGALSITIPLSGRLGAERDWRAAEYDAALLNVAEEEWGFLNDFHQAWLEWSAQGQRVALLEEHLGLLTTFADVAARLGAAGELDPGSARLFAVELGRKQGELEEARHLLEMRRHGLLSRMGLSPEAPVELVPQLALHQGSAGDVMGEVSETHPQLARLVGEYEVAEERLRVELRAQYPDIAIGPTISEEKDESVVGIGMGFPVPVWNLNRAGIAEAAAARDAARQRVYAAHEEIHAELAQRRAALQAAQAKRSRLETSVAPLADEQIAEAKALLSVGEMDLTVLYNVLLQTIEIKLELLEAILKEQTALAQIHALTAPHRLQIPWDEEAFHAHE